MNFNFDASCSETETFVKDVLDKVLGVVENSDSKRKDTIRTKLKKDPELLSMFDRLIERKAIICTSKKCSGASRMFLSIANKKFIYYAISKNIDVPTENELKEKFSYWYSIKSETLKGKIANYINLKHDTLDEGFKKYIELPLSGFTTVTDYCDQIYKEHIKVVNRTPTPNPYGDKYKNVIINKEQADEFYKQKEDEVCDDACEIHKNELNEILKDEELEKEIKEKEENIKENKTQSTKDNNTISQSTPSHQLSQTNQTKQSSKQKENNEQQQKCSYDLQAYIDTIIKQNKEESEKLKKYNPSIMLNHLKDIQKEVDEIVEDISLRLKCISTRNRCLDSLNYKDKNINVLIVKLLLDVEDFEYISNYLKNIDNICKVTKLLRKDINGTVSEEDKNVILQLLNK